jgi:hypothetical protein
MHRSENRHKRGGLNEAWRRRGDEQNTTEKFLISPPARARKVRYFVPRRPDDVAERKIPDDPDTTRRAQNRRRFFSSQVFRLTHARALEYQSTRWEKKDRRVPRCASWTSVDNVTEACFGCLPWRRDASLRTLHWRDRHRRGGQHEKLLRLNPGDIQAAIPDWQRDRFVRVARCPDHWAFTPTGRDLTGQISA